MGEIGKFLLIAAGLLAVAGVILLFADRLPLLGRLPLDFHFRKGNIELFFPLATFLLISVFLTIVINIVLRLLSR